MPLTNLIGTSRHCREFQYAADLTARAEIDALYLYIVLFCLDPPGSELQLFR